MLDVGIGNAGWHIGNSETEVDTAWLPDSGVWQWQMTLADYQARSKALFNGAPLVEYRVGTEFVTLQPRQLNWTNDRGDILVAGIPQAVTATASDDRLTWVSAFGLGRDFEWETQTARLAKKVILQSYDNLPIPTPQILTGGNPVLAPQFQFDYSSTLTVFVNGTAWVGGNRPTVDTDQPIEFRRGDGSVAFVFGTPHIFNDAEVEDRAQGVVTRVSKSGNNLLVEVRVPQPWLSTAVYPVIIDPTIDVKPNASNQDANELATGNVQIINTSFTVDGTGEWQAGRFIIPNPSAGLKSGATVDVSYITMNYGSGTLDEPDVTIYGEDTTTPGVYVAGTGTFTISSRSRTTASVPWASTNLGAPGDFNTPSLNGPVQELVNSYDYTAGGIMAFQYTSTNGTTTRDCDTTMWDGSTTLCWRLHIEYHSSILLVVQNAAQSQTSTSPALTQHQVLAVQNASQGQASTSPALVQHQALTVQNAAQGQTADNVTLTAHGPTLTVQNASQGQVADNVALTQHQVLGVQNSAQGQTADNVTLTAHAPHFTLTVQNASQGQSSTNVSLTQHQVLAVQNTSQAQASTSPTLTQHQVLAIQNADQGQLSTSPTLTQHQVLAVQDASQSQSSDNVTLTAHSPGIVVLDPQDATQGQTSTSPTLTQHQVLAVQNATQGQVSTSPALTQHQVLTAQNAAQGQASDNVTLVAHAPGSVVLDPQDATQGQTSENVTLVHHPPFIPPVALIVQDAFQGHTADNVTLVIPGPPVPPPSGITSIPEPGTFIPWFFLYPKVETEKEDEEIMVVLK